LSCAIDCCNKKGILTMEDLSISKQAVELMIPSILALLAVAGKTDLHIVIMNPQLKPWESMPEDAILHEQSIGDPKEWEHKYDVIARSKAFVTWRENSDVVHELGPAVLRSGDKLFSGSFIHQGVVVACSGIQPYFDRLISGWIALAVQQLMRHYIERHQAAYPNADTMTRNSA
jgi:hypothetical protein